MTTSIASKRPWPVAVEIGGDTLATDVIERVLVAAGTHPLRKIAGLLDDAILLLLAVFLFPLVILLIGTPIALCVRVAMEIARRW